MLVHSVSTADELVYRPQIEALKGQYSDQLISVYCVTREKISNGLQRRIQRCLTDGELEASAGIALSADDSQVMLCGNRNMIQDVMAILAARGMTKNLRKTPGQITTEHYY